MAHVAAILPQLQSTSALPTTQSPSFGDDFAAVLAGLAPSPPVAKEAPPPQHAQPANDSVAQAAPTQPQSKPRARPPSTTARADSKPAEKTQLRTANPSNARRAETSKAVAADSDEENTTTVTPVSVARPAASAQPKIELAAKSGPHEALDDSPNIAPVDSGDDAADPIQAQAAATAASAKPVSPQALADIVAAAKNAQRAAAVAPENLLKMPAGAQAIAAADTPAKPGAGDAGAAPPRASVTVKSVAPAPLAIVADKTVRALSDIAASQSQASELPDKADAGQTDSAQQQDASPDRHDTPGTNVPAQPSAKADIVQQPAQAGDGGQAALAAPPAVAAAPVASANTAAPASAAPQPAAEELTNVTDLGAVIAAKSAAGAKSFEIRLDPAELGRVEVKLTVGSDGKADATIVAHRPETLALLLRDSQNLERTLRDSGLELSNSSLNFSLKGEGRQGDGGGASKAHTRTLSNAVVARSEAANASIASLSLAPDSARLDIRV